MSRMLTPICRLIITIEITAFLWAAAARASVAQRSIFAAIRPTLGSPESGPSRTVADDLRNSVPRLRLTQMESVGSHRPPESLRSEQRLGQESSRAVSITQSLLMHLTRPGRQRDHFALLAESTNRLLDAPNRVLCRITGADRAHINLSKKRVSFTWYVSFP